MIAELAWKTLTWKIKAAIMIASTVAVFAAGAAVGGYVGSLKATAKYAGQINDLNQTIHDRDQSILTLTDNQSKLELSIADANKALAVADAQTKAAEAMQRQAMAHAGDLGKISDSRIDKLAAMASKASGCGEVLQKYWEMRE